MNEAALTSLVLQQIQTYSIGRVPNYVVRNAEPRVWIEPETKDLVMTLASHVLAERLEPSETTVTFDVPASWWQHTKAVLFPTLSRWIRRPPRIRQERRVVTAANFATFPECRRDYPKELGRGVRMSLLDWDIA